MVDRSFLLPNSGISSSRLKSDGPYQSLKGDTIDFRPEPEVQAENFPEYVLDLPERKLAQG